jgi:hypothetical protein
MGCDLRLFQRQVTAVVLFPQPLEVGNGVRRKLGDEEKLQIVLLILIRCFMETTNIVPARGYCLSAHITSEFAG